MQTLIFKSKENIIVFKFNPNHDAKGRFASGSGGGLGNGSINGIRNTGMAAGSGGKESADTSSVGISAGGVGSTNTSNGGRSAENSGGIAATGSDDARNLKSSGGPGVNLLNKTFPTEFSRQMELVSKQNSDSGKVDMHTPDEWAESGAQLFSGKGKSRTGEDSYYGAAVKLDGDVVGVFSGVPGKSKDVMLTAIANGGNRLDAYAIDNSTGEPGKLAYIYHKSGFEPVARVKFNAQYVDPNTIGGEQDIVVYKHNGDSAETVAQKYGTYPAPTKEQYNKLPVMEYDEAMAYRDSLINKSYHDNRIKKQDIKFKPPNGGFLLFKRGKLDVS